jgi:tRNA(fMet)-specific endonuclease VapC
LRYLLDANIIILVLSGASAPLRQRMAEAQSDDFATSTIAFAEVALGSWNGKAPPLLLLDQLKRVVPLLPFDELAAKQYAQLSFRRASFDRLIAAHALSLNLTLLTSNAADFRLIDGLRVENWTLPL